MWGVNGRGLVVLEEVTSWGQSQRGKGVVHEIVLRRRRRSGQVTARDEREKERKILYVA